METKKTTTPDIGAVPDVEENLEQKNQQEEVAEENLTGRQRFVNSLKQRYPDKEYSEDNEEEIYQDAMQALSDLEAESKAAEEFKRTLIETLQKFPELAVVIKKTQETGNFLLAIQSIVDDPSDLLLQEGDEGYDVARENMNKRAKDAEMQSELASKWEENSTRLPETINNWAAQNGIDDQTIDKFVDFIVDISQRIMVGDIDDKVLTQLYKSFTYDKDLAEAEEDTNIRRANQSTAPNMRKNIPPAVPMPDNSAPQPTQRQPKRNRFEEAFGM